ncbi:MAG: hypothetical protein ACR2GR_07605 [Rhodothermales bacterium]
MGSHRAALDAAEMDPDIVLFPDTTIKAQMRIITPPRAVDPRMIFPKQDPQNDGE